MAEQKAEQKEQGDERVYNIGDLPHRRAADFRVIYTNTASFGTGFFDLQMIFGNVSAIHARDDNFTPHVEDQIIVSMSWEHAKALANGLNHAIEEYEAKHGKLREARKPTA